MHTLFRQCPMVLQSPESSGLIPPQSPHLEVDLRRGTNTPGSSSSSSSITQPSLADPPRSGSNDSLTQTSTPRPQPSRWNLSISRPGHTPKSGSEDRCRGETVEPHDAKPIRPDDTAFNSPGCRPKTIWSTDDTFLPRAKPPPPLKRISHQRTRSAANMRRPEQSSPDGSSISSRASSKRSSSKPSSERLRPWSPSLDMPILDISSQHSNDNNLVADDKQRHALMRSANRMTVVSEISEVSEVCFSPAEFPSSWKWIPPSDWAGPSTGDSIVEEGRERSRSTGRQGSASEKSTQSCAREISSQVLPRPNRCASNKKLRPDSSESEVVEKEDSPDSCYGYPASKALKVKCLERNGWQEKRMADVIPILRKLKSNLK